MYKIINDYQIRKGNSFIPRDLNNIDYQKFVDDVYKNGTGIVEGADYVGVTTYTEARKAEYPPIVDQLDKIYHSGVNAWKADIKIIKDKYPKTQVRITSIAPIPDWVNTEIFNRQKEEYIKAKARLEQYELANGMKDVIRTERIWDGESQQYVVKDITGYTIEPLPLYVEGVGRNPAVVQDEAEREAAQVIINKPPQAVIESVCSYYFSSIS